MSELVSCKICVMNSTVSDIIFDKNGQCNYCKKFIKKIDLIKKTKFDLDQLVLNIKSKKKK